MNTVADKFVEKLKKQNEAEIYYRDFLKESLGIIKLDDKLDAIQLGQIACQLATDNNFNIHSKQNMVISIYTLKLIVEFANNIDCFPYLIGNSYLIRLRVMYAHNSGEASYILNGLSEQNINLLNLMA